MNLDWQERKTPREWSAVVSGNAGEFIACVYPMRDAPMALSLDVKWQVFRRSGPDGAVLVHMGYADTVVGARRIVEGLIGVAAPARSASSEEGVKAPVAGGVADYGRSPGMPAVAEQRADNTSRAAASACPAVGCGNEVAPGTDLCGRCWHDLPTTLQLELRQSRGQSGHAAVLGRAVAALETAQYGSRLL